MEYQIDNIYVKRFIYFNIYVIRGKTGDILIDTGFIGMRRELRKWFTSDRIIRLISNIQVCFKNGSSIIFIYSFYNL